MKTLLLMMSLICCFLFASCAGGGGFSSGPPVIASAGGDAFFLFPVQQEGGTPYLVGGSTGGSVAVQWKQSDGSTVMLVKPKRGNVVFYIDGKRVGAKETVVVPDDIVIPDTPPQTPAQAQEAVE